MGLLRNFCERHGIRCKRAYGEGDSVDPEAVKKSMEDVIQSIKDGNYSLGDIYNADETGLFFRMSPLKTLATKGEPVFNAQKCWNFVLRHGTRSLQKRFQIVSSNQEL